MIELNINGNKNIVVNDNDVTIVNNKEIAKQIDENYIPSDDETGNPQYTLND